VATDPRPLPHLARGGDAPADAGRDGHPLLRAISGALPDPGGAGGRAAGRGAQALGRTGVLRPSAQLPRRRTADRGRSRGKGPAPPRRPARPPGRRALHGGRGPEHCLWPADADSRWERRADPLPTLRHFGQPEGIGDPQAPLGAGRGPGRARLLPKEPLPKVSIPSGGYPRDSSSHRSALIPLRWAWCAVRPGCPCPRESTRSGGTSEYPPEGIGTFGRGGRLRADSSRRGWGRGRCRRRRA